MYCARDHPGKRESPIIQPKMHRKKGKVVPKKERERLKCCCGDRYECIGEESPDETITSQQHQTACIKRAKVFHSFRYLSLNTFAEHF